METVKSRIGRLFKEQQQNVFSKAELKQLLANCVYKIGLPGKVTLPEFTSFLTAQKIIREVTIKMPIGKKVIRYETDSATAIETAQSLKSNSYLSHYTALFLHGLTDNLPKVIYTNTELKKAINRNSEKLLQANIDRAFAFSMRQSNQIARYEDIEIYLLNSKNVDQVGVKDFTFNNTTLRVTDIERTLIDITVRPSYAGGIDEVLNAYKAAKGQISVNRMLSILTKLDYTYPYHQAIGFYLEKAGYEKDVLSLVEITPIEYDFYLTYNMRNKGYSGRWRLFYPSGM
jgi:hypothetical protein